MQVVGIFRGYSKKTEKPYTVLHCVTDFDDYQSENAEGNKVETVYVNTYVEVSLGESIEPVYGVGFEGKAIVKSVNVLVS